MSSSPLTLPEAGPAARRNRRILEILGAAAIAGTYIYLVLNQPADIASGPGSASALIALSGFLAGAILLVIAVLPTLPTTTVVLIPVALVLNIVMGQFVGSTLVPFYLDAIGTVLIAVLAGPAAGAATGALSSIVWSFFNPTVLPFAAGAALVGFLAGLAARHGFFRRFYLAPVAGFVAGILGGVVSAPVAAFVFGGTSGVATGAIVSAFRAMGDTLLGAITKQALISDPMDKAIVFTLVALLVYALPRRVTFAFPFVRRHRVLAGTRDS
ncbi:ECF transporter S component [Pseudarthrobacter sp. J75]|uniref:ECF transporter S component n=1 Tax=unclassified Pseudarthrobacter TaxID=2647000 RepID=UPI002E806CF2|nr:MULTISPECIES: ECF transporter S component [unclassified Pseudarthrobacter]MEE2522690.1 ECF transporter S component [Pseudarthrobacter sp. J47]MEE2529551.1 ECF transporter S component [Pseudarthrobacter sp. J75]